MGISPLVSVVSSLNFGCFFRLVLEIQCVLIFLFPFRVTPLCRSTLVDRYNKYFQCVIFVLAVTISHTDTPTTEDTPQHRDRVKAKLHARAKRARSRAEPQSYENVVTYPSKKFVSHVTVLPSVRLHHRETNLKCYAF